MRGVFPVIISKGESFGYVVYIPDLDVNTEGESIEDAIFMSRDAIGIWGICKQDMGNEIPLPKSLSPAHQEGDIVTLVDVDFDVYRKANDNKVIRKNLTLPNWLNQKAEQEGINFSAVLQKALIDQLNIQR